MLCDPFNLLIFFFFSRFLGSNLRILPVHNAANAVNLMCTIAKVSPLRRMAYIHTHCQTFKVPDFKCTLSSVGLTNTLLLSPQRSCSFQMQLFPKPKLSFSSLLTLFLVAATKITHFGPEEHLVMETLCWPYWFLKSSSRF